MTADPIANHAAIGLAAAPPFRALPRREQRIIALLVVLLLSSFLLLRLRYPWTFEYEAEESSIASAHFIEHGVPPRAFHHIRYSFLFVGPLHAYLKTIPYFFTLDPGGDIFLLNLLNMLSIGMLFFLLRRFYGTGMATATLLLFVVSVVSIERCTSAHVRCYSVPLTLITMVLTARVALLREAGAVVPLAVAIAFATQVYGLATIWVPPGLIILFAAFRPRFPKQLWVRAALVLLLLQVIPFIIQEVSSDYPNLRTLIAGTAFRFDPREAEPVQSAREHAYSMLMEVASTVVPLPAGYAFQVGLLVMAVGASSLLRRVSMQAKADLFLLLWLAWFLAIPLWIGVGHRTYLGQFLGPIVAARGVAALAHWLVQRGRVSARTLLNGGAMVMVATLAFVLLGPAPSRILTDPVLPIPSLSETRALLTAIRARGLGRPGFNQRVHGRLFQTDLAGDPYLFWSLCRADSKTPCSAGAGALAPHAQLVVSGPGFPYRVAEGAEIHSERYRLVEWESRLRPPFRAVAFATPEMPVFEAAAANPSDPIAKAIAARDAHPSRWEKGELAKLPAAIDSIGAAIPPLRRTSTATTLMSSYGFDPAFASEALGAPIGRVLDMQIHATLQIDRLPAADQSLHLFFSTDADEKRCQGAVFLDGTRLPARESFSEEGTHLLLELDADTSGELTLGSHQIVVQLTGCSVVNYDLYDLIVAKD